MRHRGLSAAVSGTPKQGPSVRMKTQNSDHTSATHGHTLLYSHVGRYFGNLTPRLQTRREPSNSPNMAYLKGKTALAFVLLTVPQLCDCGPSHAHVVQAQQDEGEQDKCTKGSEPNHAGLGFRGLLGGFWMLSIRRGLPRTLR